MKKLQLWMYAAILTHYGYASTQKTQQYTSAEAAVGSILAGADIVLGPRYFIEAFDAVIAAVNDGTLTEECINQSVRRILKLKKQRLE